MYRQTHEVENTDWNVLRDICEAEDSGQSAPPVYNDTLFRLARAGLVRGDNERLARITAAGRQALTKRSETGTRH